MTLLTSFSRSIFQRLHTFIKFYSSKYEKEKIIFTQRCYSIVPMKQELVKISISAFEAARKHLKKDPFAIIW